MVMVDKTGQPRSIEQLLEACNALKKSLFDIKNIDPILIHYPCIIEALQELIDRRKKDA